MSEPLATVAERMAVAEQLGRSCSGHPENVAAALPRVLDLLDGENNPEVLAAVADALGAMWDPRCLSPLLTLACHPDNAVRLSVAQALHGALYNHEVPEGLTALVELCADADPAVRDWATFGLAQCDADSDEIRAVLWRGVADPEGDTAGEALVGLARRHDPGAIEPILRCLADDPGNLIVEAATELGDPAAFPLLVKLRDDGWAESDPLGSMLTDALSACAPPVS